MTSRTFEDLEALNKEMGEYAFLEYPEEYAPEPQHLEYNETPEPTHHDNKDSIDEPVVLESGLYEDQQRALDEMGEFLDNDSEFHILAGWAGTGKSHTLKEFGKMAKVKGFRLYLDFVYILVLQQTRLPRLYAR